MEKLKFNAEINASPYKVWKILWDDATYREWTSAFAEGSHAITDWKEGSKVLFLDGKGQGMVSRIAELIPNKYMSFEHLGEVLNGVEDTTSDKVKSWAGAHENYTLEDINGKTMLYIEMDTTEEYKDYFLPVWPKALEKIKHIAEQ